MLSDVDVTRLNSVVAQTPRFLDCATVTFSERNEGSVLFANSKVLKICSERSYTSPFLT